jgi:hypothetical protein
MDKKKLFSLGEVTVSWHAEMALDMSGESSAEYIERHASGDFGEITEEEIFQNQKVINKKVKEVGDMVFSSYSLAFDQVIIWTVTRFKPKNLTIVLRYNEFEHYFPK